MADLPEARRLVERYQVGLCFDPGSPTSIATAINRMVEEPGFRAACQANIPCALQALRVDQEWDKLVALIPGTDEAVLALRVLHTQHRGWPH